MPRRTKLQIQNDLAASVKAQGEHGGGGAVGSAVGASQAPCSAPQTSCEQTPGASPATARDVALNACWDAQDRARTAAFEHIAEGLFAIAIALELRGNAGRNAHVVESPAAPEPSHTSVLQVGQSAAPPAATPAKPAAEPLTGKASAAKPAAAPPAGKPAALEDARRLVLTYAQQTTTPEAQKLLVDTIGVGRLSDLKGDEAGLAKEYGAVVRSFTQALEPEVGGEHVGAGRAAAHSGTSRERGNVVVAGNLRDVGG